MNEPKYFEMEIPVVEKIKGHYLLCPNIEDDLCSLWWKHDHCEALRGLLYDVTREDKYLRKDTDASKYIEQELNNMLKNKDVQKIIKELED